MGCGAVCGNNSSIYEPNNFSKNSLDKLFPLLSQKNDFVSKSLYRKVLKEMRQNPLKYRLKITEKIQEQQQLELNILQKWKVILYGLDNSNQNYINCLGFVKAQNEILKKPENQLKKQKDNEQSQEIVQQKQITIYYHNQFGQIQKDLDRTFQHPKFCQIKFQRILKRITNHFPKMGYTQGINFIVGFLLIIGYSQFDIFWIFVHIAINKRYLLLGLFEDGFPLSNIYKVIFKNVLKRKNRSLYEHLYQNIKLDQSIWVFKWFFTYFIYSFPFQMIKYVWDIVVQIGGIALLGFAFGIINQISDYLLQLNDLADISIFFQELKQLKTFNHYIKINKVIQAAYTLDLCDEDYQGIQNCKGGFYAQFFKESLNEKNKTDLTLTIQKKTVKFDVQQQLPSEDLLNNWYKCLLQDRIQFIKKHESQNNLNNNSQRQLFADNFASQYKLSQYSDSQSRCNISQHNFSYSHQRQKEKNQKIVNRTSLEIKNDTLPSTGYSYNKKSSRIKHCDIASQIDQIWGEESDNAQKKCSQHSQISHHSRSQQGFDKKPSNNNVQDALDKFAVTQKLNCSKSKLSSIKNIGKASSIFPSEKIQQIKPKINNYQIKDQKRSNIAMAGQSILNNLSASNTSHYQSSMSQCSKASSSKKQKQNYLKSATLNNNRYGGNIKTKTQEYKSGTQRNSVNSDRNSVADNKTICNISASNQSVHQQRRIQEQEQYNSCVNQVNRNVRLTTHAQFMVNSLRNSKEITTQKNNDVPEPIQAQIELFNDQKIFKKKNRISSKVNGAVGVNEFLRRQKIVHAVSQIDILQKQEISVDKNKLSLPRQFQLNYQQSYESILVAISQGRNSQIFKKKDQTAQFQIQSIK